MAKRIRRQTPRDFIKKIIGYTGYDIVKRNVPLHPQHLEQVTPKQFFDMFFSMVDPSQFYFVQIGANDGQSGDLLYEYIQKYRLSGLLVEPQHDVFVKLKDAYAGHSQLKFANVAIDTQSGNRSFYKVKNSLLNEKNYFEATAIASFDKETFKITLKKRIPHIIAYVSDNLEDYIEEDVIETLSFADLAKKYGVQKVDLLQIDCEGYDFEIIRMIDFARFSPRIIHYESKFFSDVDRAACEALLHKHGYQTFRHGNDTCAFK